MKKEILVLVMIAIAATAYNQPSRRSSSTNSGTNHRNTPRNTVYASNTHSARVTYVNSNNGSSSSRNRASTNSHRNHENRTSTNTYQKVHYKREHYSAHYNYRVPNHVNIISHGSFN